MTATAFFAWHNIRMDPNTVSDFSSIPQVPAGAGAPILWLFFALALLVTIYYVFAELYHWLRWGYMYPLVWLALPVYLVGVVILIGAMLTGIATL